MDRYLKTLMRGFCEPISSEIKQAVEFIRIHFAKIDSVTEIADGIAINYHTLRDRFRRETKIQMKDFLLRVRVINALNMIKDSDKQIKEIAWDVGFKYEGQLSRNFRKLLNTTPQIVRTRTQSSKNLNMGFELAQKILSSKKQVK